MSKQYKMKKLHNKRKTERLEAVKLPKAAVSVVWIRVLCASVFYYLLLVSVLITMILFKVFQLPASTRYVCGDSVEIECFSYVMEQLITTPQWQAKQFVVYMLVSLVLWPIFKKAQGKVLFNLGIVAVLVSSMLALSIENSGVELWAGVLGPLLVAVMILQRRKQKIVFNKDELGGN
jgi:hypothetical protein